jgi:hypothetical protein
MSRIDSQHWQISISRHFQNGCHNTAQIQQCPISTTFHMCVDYDVPNLFLTSKNFYWSPFSKWPLQYRANSTLFDFNEISHVGRLSGGRRMLSVICINRFITWSHDVPLNDYIEWAFPGICWCFDKPITVFTICHRWVIHVNA